MIVQWFLDKWGFRLLTEYRSFLLASLDWWNDSIVEVPVSVSLRSIVHSYRSSS